MFPSRERSRGNIRGQLETVRKSVLGSNITTTDSYLPKEPTRMSTILHPISKSLALCTLLCGCTLPPPLDVISIAKTAIDLMLMVEDKPTTTDMMLSKITRKECRTTNIIRNKTMCTEDTKNNDPKKKRVKQEINNNDIVRFMKEPSRTGRRSNNPS